MRSKVVENVRKFFLRSVNSMQFLLYFLQEYVEAELAEFSFYQVVSEDVLLDAITNVALTEF